MQGKDNPILAVGYVRVSSEEQAHEGYSLDEQEREIRERAEREGWSLVKVYADRGLSGRRADRPDFRQMLEDAAAGAFQRLIAWKLDRLGRSTRLVLEALQALEAGQVEFISLRENVDTSTPAGRYMRTNLAAIAEMEGDMISERTKIGLAGRRRKGRRPGGPPPFGFDYVRDRDNPDDKGTLVENEREADIVRYIYREFLARPSVSALVRDLRAKGWSTKRGAKFAQYHVTTILDNPIHAGWLYDEDGKTLIDAAHEGLVPRETWLAVLDIRRARRASSGKGRGRNPARPHLLTRGLGRCGRCGAALIPRGNRYVCRNRHQSATAIYQPSRASESTTCCSASSSGESSTCPQPSRLSRKPPRA